MHLLKKYIGDLFLPTRFFVILTGFIALFIMAFYLRAIFGVVVIGCMAFMALVAADYAFLFFPRKVPVARRITAGRMSNGDENIIELLIRNEYRFAARVTVIEELPAQFQDRKWKREISVSPTQSARITYRLTPKQRGAYHFGDIHLMVSTPLGLLIRRCTSPAAEEVPVYPAFMQLHKYELFSNAILQTEGGGHRMPKIGQSMEFEQIKDYVNGDDIRRINWKATARKSNLMVNHFVDERSQLVYSIIDKGRLMKMPFGGLTLLDYAINSCLVLSNVCLKKGDRAGVITFSNTLGSVLAADRKATQNERILQLLYNQTTDFLESDFEMLYLKVRSLIKNRSLIVLYTNFESMSGLNRQLEYLRAIAAHHLLLVVFFENSELDSLTLSHASSIEEVYIKTTAEKFAFEKRLIARELMKYGILSLLTSPKKLTVNAINKYLELKTRQAI
ncbi:MAG: DUF58 domain-containing protein [Bacteroidota bacterium]|nr:DUF58 domain-containing protein [Bacteroidota bacterium]